MARAVAEPGVDAQAVPLRGDTVLANNQIPYISLVDAGMLELIRSFGKEVVTSANLVARFESHVDRGAASLALQGSRRSRQDHGAFFQEVGKRVRNGGTHEFEMQQWIMEAFGRDGLENCDPPNVSETRTAAIRITSLVRPRQLPSSRATLCCSTSGQSWRNPTRCTTT